MYSSSLTPILGAVDSLSHPIFLIFALVVGACVGSFLNVVIYRVPREIGLSKPLRSFCPSCKKQIPSWLNIPILSWILLRGKCAECKSPIAVRYVMVEALTALLFGIVWVKFSIYGWPIALMIWIFISLLISATFIDFEHYIIPDGITIGGMIVGLALAALTALVPPQWTLEVRHTFELHGVRNVNWLRGLCYSGLGAATGFALIWTVVQLGKLAFGRNVRKFEKPQAWKIYQPNPDDEPQLEIGDETLLWSDMFARESDKLVIEVSDLMLNGKADDGDEIIIFWNRAEIGETTINLEQLELIEGKTLKMVQPREAMGFGDVKFVAMIGAFLGWEATVFSLVGGAVIGALVGTLQRVIGGERWAKPIPFGPYLALAAMVYLFWGEAIKAWYIGLSYPG
ncbi:MAG: leader peptidase (prepilin peptidase)/N-methyltransferase [Verrucomicrobiales bacterium]|jgi:leader peptidase (prepilin peptidase)/N-methyltransferase